MSLNHYCWSETWSRKQQTKRPTTANPTISGGIECTDNAFSCPDRTYLSRDDPTCQFPYDDCCKEECEDGTILTGTLSQTSSGGYYCGNDDGTVQSCDDDCDEEEKSCPDGLDQDMYYADDSCTFDMDDCCYIECEKATNIVEDTIYGVVMEDDAGNVYCDYDTSCDDGICLYQLFAILRILNEYIYT